MVDYDDVVRSPSEDASLLTPAAAWASIRRRGLRDVAEKTRRRPAKQEKACFMFVFLREVPSEERRRVQQNARGR